MVVCSSVGKLNSSDASQIVEESTDVVVGSISGKLCLTDQEICLGDIGRGYVVAQKEDGDCGLGVGILT